MRLYTLFLGPPEKDAEWSDQGIEGAFRFLKRVWRFVAERRDALRAAAALRPDLAAMNPAERELYRKANETIRTVTADLEGDFHFNTAIAQIMELLNALESFRPGPDAGEAGLAVMCHAAESMVLLLAPLAPHLAEELWVELGHEPGILGTPWPSVDAAALARDEVELALQVNGKFRGTLRVPAGADRALLEEKVLAHPQVARAMTREAITKWIVVPDKLVNLVVRR